MKYNPLKIVEGTRVRILNPVFVLRVGYENDFKNVRNEVLHKLKRSFWEKAEEELGMKTVCEILSKKLRSFVTTKDFQDDLFPFHSFQDQEFGPDYYHSRYEIDREKLTEKIASLMAYQIVGLRMQSSNQERKLFTEEKQEALFSVRTVRSISYNKIGVRFAGNGGSDDYEPGGLDKQRTVKILHFHPDGFSNGKLIAANPGYGDRSSIEAKDIEVVIEVLDKYKEFTDWYEKNPSLLSIRQQIDALQSIKSYHPKSEEEEEKNLCYCRCITVFVKKNLEEADWTSPPFEECNTRENRHTREEKEIKQRDYLIENFGHHFTSKIVAKIWGLCSDMQREHLFRESLWDSEFIFDHFETSFFSEEEKAEIRKEVINNVRKLSIVGDRRILSSLLNFETYINERAW